jgi:hypothetical protein
MDCSAHPELALQLIQVFKSQVAGGKRYDTASIGRRQANATFHASHSTDAFTQVAWALDLTPLVEDETLSVTDFAFNRIERLRADTATRLSKLT